MITGSYTLTFDPTQTYTDATAGLTVNSFSYNFSTPVATGFSYIPNTFFLFGGLLNGVNNVQPATNDYFVAFPLAGATSTEPAVLLLATGSLEVSYSVSETTTVTPEPSSLALIGTGLMGVVGVMRRRFA